LSCRGYHFWSDPPSDKLTHRDGCGLLFRGTAMVGRDTYDFIEKTFGHDEAPEVPAQGCNLPGGKKTAGGKPIPVLGIWRSCGLPG